MKVQITIYFCRKIELYGELRTCGKGAEQWLEDFPPRGWMNSTPV